MPVPCAICSMPLPAAQLSRGGEASCMLCGAENTVRAFPALLAPARENRPEVAIEGEAACFDHPAKRAVSACQQCGRFVCRLCAVDFGESIWCPGCVAGGKGQARAANPDAGRMLYDSMALILPLASLLLYPLSIAAAPAALVVSTVKWREPLSLVRRSRWRFIVAIVISIVEIGFWIVVFYLFFRGLRQPKPVIHQ